MLVKVLMVSRKVSKGNSKFIFGILFFNCEGGVFDVVQGVQY